VFFLRPRDGATFPPYELGAFEQAIAFEFGVEGYRVAAAPRESGPARPGVGHFHFGVDTGCVPEGEIIPRNSNWFHLENGETTFDRILRSPGRRTFAVQLGDDQQRALPGLCATLTLTVLQ
jgi:hypothetical protein